MRFPPGSSFEATSPEAAKSVIAVPMMGMGLSAVAWTAAWAAGVPIARIRSTPSLANWDAMVVQVDVLLVGLVVDSRVVERGDESLVRGVERGVLRELKYADGIR